ncbi:hypothetical protein [Halobacterium rubrum]|uniref:hypothetical protein n=1 Tax=Halobacterium TaxID=2239 RepID=UPI001F2CF333|nr:MULTISPECIES: hypothetical protein [Halobacterium]MDH5018828.1 hypothetical protein [Halobacterium rubrum]
MVPDTDDDDSERDGAPPGGDGVDDTADDEDDRDAPRSGETPRADDETDSGRRTDPVTPSGGGPDHARGVGEPADGSVDSNWWYWVASVPVYWVVATVAGFAIGLLAFAFALTGAAGFGHMGGIPGAGFGLGAFGFAAVAVLLAFAGMVVSLVFPVAVYLDAEAVADARRDWQPDPALYGLLGLAGVVAQPLQVPLAVYYLYKRHESVGRP